jgi:capsular exopolysaccharide synthesis family protein
LLIDSADVFVTGDDPENVLGIPTLGFIPRIENPDLRLLGDVRTDRTFSIQLESFRTLRANIRFVTETPPRTLMVASAVPAEGKSTLVANLASAMAMAIDRNRVIILDADLRRPRQHRLFGLEPWPGLAEVLAGTHTIADVLRPTTVANVMVLPAGSPPWNPMELLESDAMGTVLAELETLCDITLVDSPPILAIADGPVIAARMDGVLLLIGHGETKRRNVQQALHILGRSRAKVLGTVLNRMSGPDTGYYYEKEYVATDPSAGPRTEGAKESAIGRRETGRILKTKKMGKG